MNINGHEIKPCANLRGADLTGADLYAANLRGADLTGADLYAANLRGANLRGANLYRADLAGASLYGADLREADLRRASLYGADFTGADFTGAKLNWDSHDLIAEILRQAAGANMDRRGLAGLILMSRDRCWDYWLKIKHREKQWALDVLDQWEGRPGR